MPSSLQTSLGNITRDLLTMSAMVEEAVRKALAALTDGHTELVDEVIRGDKKIDLLEDTIDKACAQVLALQQPVADDLRLILTVLMVNSELERAGDHAKSIAIAAGALAHETPLPVYEDLKVICEQVLKMLDQSIDALINKDPGVARVVRENDDLVDQACDELEARIVDLMRDEPDRVKPGVQVIQVVQRLERIADLATNIAKDVIYLVEGDIEKHRSRTATEIFGNPLE